MYKCELRVFFYFSYESFIEAQTLVERDIDFFGGLLVEIQSSSKFSRCFLFLSLSFLFLHFPTCQTPLEDDNSRDGWLNPLHP